jgi:ATP-dependent RNA helicase DDX3X
MTRSKQDIPDFLEQHMPDDPTKIDWHDGTDDESDDGFGGLGGGEAPAFDADAGFGGEAAGEVPGDTGGDTGFGGDDGGFGGGDAGGFGGDDGGFGGGGFSAGVDDKVASW